MYYRRKLTCECNECNRNRKAGAEREETMNQYITAAVIKELREKHQMTQLQLAAAEPEESDEHHMIFMERVEDEYFVRIDHEMTKQHYISFIAALSSDRIQMVKLYPEGNAEARFKINGVKKILFYCNRDGLFFVNPRMGIDDKPANYDDTEDRRQLEKVAAMLFR